jgi:hypothetical protein
MNDLTRGTRAGYALASAGLGLLSIAFTVHPVRVSPLVFWALVGSVGAIAIAVASITFAPFRRKKKPQPHVVGPECRRVSDAVGRLLAEQWASLLAGGGGFQPAAWRRNTETRYLEDLQEWALGVFDDAVACEAISRSSRPLVRRPRAEHLEKIRDLFREAADSLDCM